MAEVSQSPYLAAQNRSGRFEGVEMEDAERALLRVRMGLVALSLTRRSIVPSAWGRSNAMVDE